MPPSPAESWLDFWPKLSLILADKVVLGAAALLVAFWFQRRLEQVRRNQAVFTEHAKMAVAAFNRVLSRVHDVRSAMGQVLATDVTKAIQDRIFKQTDDEIRYLMEDRYLLGQAFYSTGIRLAAVARRSTATEDHEDFLAYYFHVEDLLAVMLASRPNFAQLPIEEQHFTYPTTEEASRRAGVRDTWPALDDVDPEPMIPEGARARAVQEARRGPFAG